MNSRENRYREFEERRAFALGMGGPEKLGRRRAVNLLNARERVERLLDEKSFLESGLHGVSVFQEASPRTPADGKIVGYGRISNREVAVVSNDFTVMGASSSATNSKKIGQVKRVATQRGIPIVFLGESSGARMPDTMGARGMGTMLGNDPTQYQRRRETPWAAAVLGMCYGSSTWYTCCSDFAVMRKGAIMAVSSPTLVEQATKEQVDAEQLGGWQLQAETTGLIDLAVASDEEALVAIRRFLSYMPSHHNELPPRVDPCPAPMDADIDSLLPASRTKVYDVRLVIRAIVDADSVFELKARFAKAAVTALARIDGRSVGVVANNPMYRGGALDTDACEKITSFLVLCDSFNIPIIMLVDTPGFSIGIEAERRKAPGKIMNYMNALSLCTVPKISVIMRKSYGQAYLNMGGGRNSDEVAAWPHAEVSFMDPVFAAKIVSGKDAAPADLKTALNYMQKDSSVYDIAGLYSVQYLIKPTETRDFLKRMLEVHQSRLTNGIGQHLMRSWPTSY